MFYGIFIDAHALNCEPLPVNMMLNLSYLRVTHRRGPQVLEIPKKSWMGPLLLQEIEVQLLEILAKIEFR